jgi:signal transduction histidine kinase
MTILVKLVTAFVLPTMMLFAGFAYLAHDVARRDLEAELGTRLAAIAATAATNVRGKYLVDVGVGDDQDRSVLNTQRRLVAVLRESGVARVYVFDRDFRVKVSTDSDSPPGSEHHYAQLHRVEIERVLDAGIAAPTVLFSGKDGKKYLAAYAPVRAAEDDPDIVLALGVDASPTYFDRLAELRRSLYLYGALLMVVVAGIAVLMATFITRPVRKLATAAERIGRGELDVPIVRSSRDEIGLLAETMDAMRADLRARDERLQMMLAGVAHEVRNPLGGMRLFTSILRDELPEGAEARDHVARIDREVGYLETVVAEFLDYARRPKPELGRCELGGLVEEVLEVVGPDAEAAGVTLSRSGPDRVACLGDAGQLRRALLNLVRNAIQAAARTRAEVAVELSAGDEVAVRVSNGGTPIPADAVEHLFEPFFTTREKGTGLGLAFVRDIAVDHGGRVELERSDEDGTVFVLVLQRPQAQSS